MGLQLQLALLISPSTILVSWYHYSVIVLQEQESVMLDLSDDDGRGCLTKEWNNGCVMTLVLYKLYIVQPQDCYQGVWE